MEKYITEFSSGKLDESLNNKLLLGNKGANLREMAGLGLNVPPGFIISTEVYNYYFSHNKNFPQELNDKILQALNGLEKLSGKKFGDPNNPLLLSVRSGAPVSMPGMMDTILNLGINDEVLPGMIKWSGSERFAYDVYLSFIQAFASVVYGMDSLDFEQIIADYSSELSIDDMRQIVVIFKDLVRDVVGTDLPEDPMQQLHEAIKAVFDSWMSDRAVSYRRIRSISEDLGTAVVVQVMVFGNVDDRSATGVMFTRNPSTGASGLFGEYLVRAQGEDIVSGTKVPLALSTETMGAEFPDIYSELGKVASFLEGYYKDMQDIEFTVEMDKLWILQTRGGKRTAEAALKIAVDMHAEDILSKEEAICRIDPYSLDNILHPVLDDSYQRNVLAKGLPASPGAAVGAVTFSSVDAQLLVKNGKDVILVRNDTSPEDINGMNVAVGMLTARGGMTSHAAVVARGMGKPCVCGVSRMCIDSKNKFFRVGDIEVREGDVITLNGSNGEVILGSVPTKQPKMSENFLKLLEWSDQVAGMKVLANADNEHDAKAALELGAQGIGLCRTEHMFFAENRILAVRRLILADSSETRSAALDKLYLMQKGDFEKIFKVMAGLPVTVRLLDPPLHEFIPRDLEAMQQVAETTGKSIDFIRRRVAQIEEANPMLGHRGCRLGISYPEIYQMQTRAILEAVASLQAQNVGVYPEIMVPLVMDVKEFMIIKKLINDIANKLPEKVEYKIGVMIELPRAALKADEIADLADFFSFGTNDLTQTTLGMSRDDSHNFIPLYLAEKIFNKDPFCTLDITGVGELVKIATKRGRSKKSSLKIGLCGEHGGDAETIFFCHQTGIDYVSCSPYRVPVARLLAAQAALKTND